MTSTAVRVSAPSPAGARRAAPSLALVPPRPRVAPRGPFVALVVTVLAGGLLGLLLLNTVVAQQSFAVHELQRTSAQLALQEQALQQEVARLESPASLAHRAGLLGMVPAGDPVFLRLPDGAVLGNPVPAEPPAAPAGPAAAGAATPATPAGDAVPAEAAAPAE